MASDTPFCLTVNGRAEIPLPAERAIIDVAVSSEGPNKIEVSKEIIQAAKQIEAMLRDLSPKDETLAAKAAAPLAHWSKTSLSSTSYMPPRRDNEEQKPRHYRGNIKFDIRFQDFKALGAFGTKISSIPHVEVNNIDWKLTDKTEAEYKSQLRKESTKDAVTKARDYCEALGCVNLRPVELFENSSYSHMSARYAVGAAMGFSGLDEEEEEEEEESGLEFDPQEIKMSMEISVKFHAE